MEQTHPTSDKHIALLHTFPHLYSTKQFQHNYPILDKYIALLYLLPYLKSSALLQNEFLDQISDKHIALLHTFLICIQLRKLRLSRPKLNLYVGRLLHEQCNRVNRYLVKTTPKMLQITQIPARSLCILFASQRSKIITYSNLNFNTC